MLIQNNVSYVGEDLTEPSLAVKNNSQTKTYKHSTLYINEDLYLKQF